MKTAHVVFEHQFDQDTLDEFASLRLIRLGIAERQLANLDETLDELVERGLLESTRKENSKRELKSELTQKVNLLRVRNVEAQDIIFLDEVEFYLKVIGEQP